MESKLGRCELYSHIQDTCSWREAVLTREGR